MMETLETIILEANCRMTQWVIDRVSRYGNSGDILEVLQELSEHYLYYRDFTSGLDPSVSPLLAYARVKVEYFVPYVLAKVVDPLQKAEFAKLLA